MLQSYKNGNAIVTLFSDGSREIDFENELSLDYPLNIDIRVSTRCAFGQKPDGSMGVCSFCHESAKTDGSECDYELLKEKLSELPKGIELAIGSNNLSYGLYGFLVWAKNRGFICNLTINQGHLLRDLNLLKEGIKNEIIYGLGISYRKELKWNVPQELLDYDNTVFHVISGIDTFSDIEGLSEKGVKKILILGEKDFGFNKGNVDLTSRNHKEWYWWVHKLFSKFSVVSFDNLSLEQLNIKRFFSESNWEVFNQGENSFYINSVDKYFAPSSRSDLKTSWDNITIKNYFKSTMYGQ
jgi:hypothetical protein